jgi:DNA-binding GntR family transcriptional regulator
LSWKLAAKSGERKRPERYEALALKIHRALREDILDRSLDSKTPLVPGQLAERFSTSATPVREALLMLEQEGLVETIPHRGTIVSSLSVDEVKDLFHLRTILEGAAAELAATTIEPASLQMLEAFNKGYDPDGPGELGPLVDKNERLHLAIVRLSGNRRLERTVATLLGEMRRIISTGFVPNDHGEILEALRAKDGVAARQAMVRHIRRVEDQVLRRRNGAT